MVKNLLYAFLFPLLLADYHLAFAHNWPEGSGIPISELSDCNAPPPDSFRITGIGYKYLALAWTPAWVGADHLLTVYENNTSSTDSLFSVYVVADSSYIFTDLDPVKAYKISIRTICRDGDISTEFSLVNPPVGTILELTVGGFVPENPLPASCISLPYDDFGWLGFEFERLDEELNVKASTVFQFTREGDGFGRIKRVEGSSSIELVAANEFNEWPIFPNQIVKVYDFSFLGIDKTIQNGNSVFGYIQVRFNPGLMEMCPILNDPDLPWNPLYTFKTYANSKAECPDCPPSPGGGLNGQSRFQSETSEEIINVQTPFSDYLTIFFPNSGFIASRKTISIFDLKGNLVFSEQIEVPEPHVIISTEKLASGFYILALESNGELQYFKTVKAQ